MSGVSQTLPLGYAELLSDIKLTRALPENLGSSLPSIEQIERELQGDEA
ncbi:hypothetical protein DFR44_1369 [Hydromonas duriensis]|uniref:Uncharacterized protein n=1 Tax=Hydromonas duriensis TaxID=1527608 RepID=A0A4V3DJF4_9BURK|nr:hypothetical protein [Hydromonas duriensis]TDR27866.1 hypothetical protein DFR44_1369 [Hydromonas duriensis]